jgi:peptidoglycan/xylan/chitin deacetylase (PgdA/CDA1 family)
VAAGRIAGIPPAGQTYHKAGIVLLYHGLQRNGTPSGTARSAKYWVASEDFKQHLEAIREQNLPFVSLGDFYHGVPADLHGGRPIVITFDDGRSSDFESAFPLLLDSGACAAFFLNTANVGKPGYITWPQAAEMNRSGMSIESHSHEHVYLTRLSPPLLRQQLAEPKQMIEGRLGSEVQFLSLPYGECSARVVEVASQLGYRAICTSRTWPARSGRRFLDRIPVFGDTALPRFRELLTGSPRHYIGPMAREFALRIPKLLYLHFGWRRIQEQDRVPT